MFYLVIVVKAPEVELALSINGGKQCRVDWRPLYVVHVVAVSLERAQWRTSLALSGMLHTHRIVCVCVCVCVVRDREDVV